MTQPIRKPSTSDTVAHDASPGELVVIGKDILELLSSAMYTDPLTIYREYVQNAADAIQEARRTGLISPDVEGRVQIHFDHDARRVRIRDNGTGLPVEDAARRLLAIGASSKRGTKARGFRGIGRLAGLAYCRELVFRTRALGDTETIELSWDCVRLRAALRAIEESDDLPGVVDKIVSLHRRSATADDPSHFFEVELRDVVRHYRHDALLNEDLVGRYLSDVAPVPFDSGFRFAEAIEAHLSQYCERPHLVVTINGAAPLCRPHGDVFPAKAQQDGHLSECELLTFEDRDGGVAAVGWLLHHEYLGAIPQRAQIGGLRLRSGDIQVGGDQVLIDYFPEPRFNAWTVAEIHVVDPRIVPNARRDQFEHNVHFNDLTAQFEPLARQIARRCRNASIDRNRAKALQTSVAALSTEVRQHGTESVAPNLRLHLHRCIEAMRSFARRYQAGEDRDDPIWAALGELEVALEDNIAS